ncbi:MAG: PIN domain-containing protein [Gammaproteobacteria bacterium]
MNRVFLDANVLFSAAWREKAGLLSLWRLTDVTLLTSRYAFEEARRNLETQEQRKRLIQLMVNVDLVTDFAYGDLPLDVVLPEKDRPILLAAIRAHATHLLTGDKQHFGLLYGQSISGVLILRPADYPGFA